MKVLFTMFLTISESVNCVLISHELHGIFYLCYPSVTGITGNLSNKCPKRLLEQNCSSSDYFNVISGFTSNSRAPGGPVTNALVHTLARRKSNVKFNKLPG